MDKLPLSHEGRQLLPEYIQFLQGPACLTALVGVSEVFLELLQLQGFQDFPVEAAKFQSLAKELVANEWELRAVIPKIQASREKKPSTVLRGLFIAHPAYVLLYFQTQRNSKALRRLQQALLTAINNPQPYAYSLKPTDIQGYGLAIRQITEVKVGQKWLSDIDEQELRSLGAVRERLAELVTELTKNAPDFSTEGERDYKIYARLVAQIHVAHLLLDASTGHSVTRRDTSGKRAIEVRTSLGTRGASAIRSGEICEERVLGDLDDASEHPTVYAVVKIPEDPDVLNELKALGVEPSEAQEAFEFIFVRHQCLPAYAQAFNDALRTRGAIKRMELQNQFLPLSTQLLNDQDLRALGSLLQSLDSVDSDQLLALLIRVIFVTSSPLQRAKNLQIVKAGGNKFHPGAESIGYDLRNQAWLLPVFPLDLKTQFSADAATQCRNTEVIHFALPDLFGFHKKLTAFFGDDVPEFPFEKLREPEKKIRKTLSATNSRLTLSRLERYMTLMAAGRFEATQATYLFSNYLSTSSARRFYTALSIDTYRAIYRELCSMVLKSTGYNTTLGQSPTEGQDMYIGARYCPETAHVRSVLRGMVVQLEHIRRNLLGAPGMWIEFHNRYTTYVIYAQGILTGIRSVESPFVDQACINSDVQIAVFRDKDSADQFHTRTIPLHSLTREFAEFYHRHREAVLVRLASLNPSATLELRRITQKDAPFIFFLLPDGQWQTVRPGRLAPLLSQHTDLPLNSNRKFIRSQLLEKGISAHAIDTLLGHASRGEPFWGACSTRSFREIADEVLNGLDSLAEQIDLQVVKGLQV